MKVLSTQRFTFIGAIFIALFATSCRKDKTIPPVDPEVKKYLHLSHTRTNANLSLANNLESKDYSAYDLLMLGGDMNWLSSEDNATMNYLDGVFDFGSERTLWSLGNHDYTDTALINDYTGRLTYYAYHLNGITFIVLDTQVDDCSIANEQLTFFNSVVDTLQESSHLVLIHHKLIWMPDNSYLEPQISSVSNGSQGTLAHQLQYNNFYDDIYPALHNVHDQGIKVICIGGDIGLLTDQFSYVDANGISFLASGVNHENTENYALVFDHSLEYNSLSWNFVSLDDL